MNTQIIDIIKPFLIGRYERLKDNINDIFKDLSLSDFNEDDIPYIFSELLITSVEPVNKPLTFIFVKENYNLIISHSDKDHNNP